MKVLRLITFAIWKASLFTLGKHSLASLPLSCCYITPQTKEGNLWTLWRREDQSGPLLSHTVCRVKADGGHDYLLGTPGNFKKARPVMWTSLGVGLGIRISKAPRWFCCVVKAIHSWLGGYVGHSHSHLMRQRSVACKHFAKNSCSQLKHTESQ